LPAPCTPERKLLLEQYKLLKSECVCLMNDRQELQCSRKPQLEALYATRVGCWMIERLQLQLRVLALKRKTELLQGALNREEEVDLDEIELDVAQELAAAEAAIMQQVASLEGAKVLLNNLLSAESTEALRSLYRSLARQLHPDVNPELTEAQKEIWLLVQEAYENCDLEKLKAIQIVYESEIQAAAAHTEALPDQDLQQRIATMKAAIRSLHEGIASLRNTFPFTIEQQIFDDDWVAREVSGVKEELAILQAYEATLLEEFKQLTRML
jgi:hypothetical protein